MMNCDTAFCQNFLKISIGDRIAQVKEDCEKDNTFRELRAFEIDHYQPPMTITEPTDLNAVIQKQKPCGGGTKLGQQRCRQHISWCRTA